MSLPAQHNIRLLGLFVRDFTTARDRNRLDLLFVVGEMFNPRIQDRPSWLHPPWTPPAIISPNRATLTNLSYLTYRIPIERNVR